MEHEVFTKLRAEMKQQGFDALVALTPDNVTYTAGVLIPSHVVNRFRRTISILAGNNFSAQIVVDVEENLAREFSRFSNIHSYNQFTENPSDLLADLLEDAGLSSGRIAIELDFMPAMDYVRLIERLPQATFEHARDIYFHVRMTKTDEEIERLTEVGVMTETVIAEILDGIHPGETEKEVGARIADKMLRLGADHVRYHVGSGVRSGITNCDPTDKVIEKNDVLRIEVLGDHNNYRSNVTRTAVVGKPTQEQKDIWAVLIEAKSKCESILRPGIQVPDLYQTYVNACRSGGIEPTLKFLGHGIGLTIHEEPYITDTRKYPLGPNMTHTMEPLFMIPGKMGFHVEDMYRITDSGFSRITGELLPNHDLIEIKF